jgi:hypothetical protein
MKSTYSKKDKRELKGGIVIKDLRSFEEHLAPHILIFIQHLVKELAIIQKCFQNT